MNRIKTFSAGKWAVMMGMALLLAFPGLSLTGAQKGLLLWYTTVLPTLLPFMIFSGMLIRLHAVPLLTAPFSPLLNRWMGLSEAGAFTLICGVLCGYPMGAKTCSDFLEQKAFSAAEARTLLACGAFPSPMFLAGYMMEKAAASAAPAQLPFWNLAAAVYLPAIPIFLLASRFYGFSKKKQENPQRVPVCEIRSAEKIPSPPPDDVLTASAETMVKIGIYLMLFSILAEFLFSLPLPGKVAPVILVSAAEMTTGMNLAAESLQGLPGLLMIVGAGAFGGFSGVFQTKSVLKNAGLSIRHYILWKTIHMLGACLMFTLLWSFH